MRALSTSRGYFSKKSFNYASTLTSENKVESLSRKVKMDTKKRNEMSYTLPIRRKDMIQIGVCMGISIQYPPVRGCQFDIVWIVIR